MFHGATPDLISEENRIPVGTSKKFFNILVKNRILEFQIKSCYGILKLYDIRDWY